MTKTKKITITTIRRKPIIPITIIITTAMISTTTTVAVAP